MKTFMVILVVFIGVTTMYAQEKPASPKYALSFGIADNFRLDKFNGSIAVKKILDDEHEIRLFINPALNDQNLERKIGSNTETTNEEYLSLMLGAGADYLWILMRSDDVNLYGGPGVVLSYGYVNHKTTSESNGQKNFSESKNPILGMGIRGVLGVEWMVSKKIGIHSEYHLSSSYNWSKTESTYSSSLVLGYHSSTTTTNTFSINSAILFGVSIYL